MVKTLEPPIEKNLNTAVRTFFMSQDNESSLARCCHACPVCHAMCLKEYGHLDKHDGHHQPLGLAGISGYKSGQLSFQSCYDVVQKKGYVCDQGFKGLPKNLKSFKSQDMFKGWVLPEAGQEEGKQSTLILSRLMVEFNRQYAHYYNKKENSEESLSKMKDQIRKEFGTIDLKKIAEQLET